MNQDNRQEPIDMPRGSRLRIEDGAGVTLHVREGELWLTEEGGHADHFLDSGQQFRISRDGVTLVYALKPSVVFVSPAMPGDPAPGLGRALRRFFARLLAPLSGHERLRTAPTTRVYARLFGSGR